MKYTRLYADTLRSNIWLWYGRFNNDCEFKMLIYHKGCFDLEAHCKSVRCLSYRIADRFQTFQSTQAHICCFNTNIANLLFIVQLSWVDFTYSSSIPLLRIQTVSDSDLSSSYTGCDHGERIQSALIFNS